MTAKQLAEKILALPEDQQNRSIGFMRDSYFRVVVDVEPAEEEVASGYPPMMFPEDVIKLLPRS